MKKNIFLIGIVVGLASIACNNQNEDENLNQSSSKLFFKSSTETNIKSSDSEQDSWFTGTIEPAQETVIEFCTGEDLEWYNETTSELKFKDQVTKNTLILNFFVYLDGEFLFGLGLIPNVMSYVVDVPVLERDLHDGSRYYIAKGYPNWDLNKYDKENLMRIEREKNWKTLSQSKGWELFIQQLKKEGKYRK